MTVDKSDDRIREMFGEISPRYDFLNHLLSGGADWYWRRRTVRTVRPVGDAPILDVCSGTGDLAIAYWKRGGRAAPVIGTDFAHPMLQLANAKFAKLRSSAVRPGMQEAATMFLEADTLQLPFASDRFQIVSVAFGLRNVRHTERGLREMVRVCRPGGKVVVLEFSMPSNRVLRAVYGLYFRHVLPRIGQLFARSRAAAYSYLPASVSDFPQGAELAELMTRCGLACVSYKPLTFGIATLYYGEKPAARE